MDDGYATLTTNKNESPPAAHAKEPRFKKVLAYFLWIERHDCIASLHLLIFLLCFAFLYPPSEKGYLAKKKNRPNDAKTEIVNVQRYAR